jgi:leucyl/phenylalanyl-tRNA---protein transferase
MSVQMLTNNPQWFPPITEALEDGLLAFGGEISIDRLLAAYSKGIFPWYDGDTPLWWCPHPRFVLFPPKLRVSKSMLQVIKSGRFSFTINRNFKEVIAACKTIYRKEQLGTWINPDIELAYTKLHKLGYAISAEAWENNHLVGGLYGVKLGNVFFGESMFSRVSNASKFAFIKLVETLQKEHIALIDCQVYTSHLESLGAEMLDRADFIHLLQQHIPHPPVI